MGDGGFSAQGLYSDLTEPEEPHHWVDFKVDDTTLYTMCSECGKVAAKHDLPASRDPAP